MIIAKTKMKEIPTSCKECELHAFGFGSILCPILKDWLTAQEFRSGKVKLDNCPLEEK